MLDHVFDFMKSFELSPEKNNGKLQILVPFLRYSKRSSKSVYVYTV